MAVMMKRSEDAHGTMEGGYEEPLLAVYRVGGAMLSGFAASEFWRQEIRLEVAKEAFHRGTGRVPWRQVTFDLEDRGMKHVDFVEYEEPDDLTW